MAEVMNSLFGMTPESLMAERDTALQQQALQYAKLDPFQRATAGIYAGANRLGGAIGGMLGAQDPEMMRLQQRQQLLQGANISDPKVLRERATVALQQNDYAAAQQLANRAMDIEAKQASIAKDSAAAIKDLRIPTPTDARTNEEKNASTYALTKGTVGSPEYKSAFSDKFVELTTKEGSKPTKVGITSDGTQRAVYSDGKTQFVFANDPEGKLVKKTYVGGVDQTTARVSATASSQAEGKYAETFGKGLADKDLALKDLADAAPTALESVKTTRNLLDSGKVFTGTGAGVKLNVLALGQSLGVTGGNADEVVANTQQLQQKRSQAVLNQIKTSGLGAGQGFTDKDLQFLQDASAGRITLSAETLRRQLDLEEKAFKTSAKRWNERLKTMDQKMVSTMGLNPVLIEPAPDQQGNKEVSPKPIKRYNPATGKIETM
jgi:hypothetical protein